MFTPLCTVLTTALSAAILHEQLHVGRHALSSSSSSEKDRPEYTIPDCSFSSLALLSSNKPFLDQGVMAPRTDWFCVSLLSVQLGRGCGRHRWPLHRLVGQSRGRQDGEDTTGSEKERLRQGRGGGRGGGAAPSLSLSA